jgi:hypothetical protein
VRSTGQAHGSGASKFFEKRRMRALATNASIDPSHRRSVCGVVLRGNWPWEQRNKLQKPYAAYRAPPPLRLHGGRIYGGVQSVGTQPQCSACLHYIAVTATYVLRTAWAIWANYNPSHRLAMVVGVRRTVST